MAEMGILTMLALIFWALSLAGVLWVSEFVVWIFSHKFIVGGFLLLIHILFSIVKCYHAYINYSIKGVICAIIHAIFPPIVVVACYYASIESINDGTSIFSFSFNWILAFLCMLGTSYLGYLALDTVGHSKSNLRLFGFTILNVLLSIQLVGMISYNGF